MRSVTKTFKVYKYSEASDELKEKIKDNFRASGCYGDWIIDERINSLKAFAKVLGGTLDYSISLVPHRGEYIKMSNISNPTSWYDLEQLGYKDCPLTGVCYDDDLIHDALEFNSIQKALNKFLKSIHQEYESMFDDEYLAEHCEANEYEFTEDGKLY